MKLFEEGFFWETHELLEPVWMACPPNSPQKLLVQAVIQQANARLKELMGRQKAALRLKAKAEALWREAFADPSRTILGLTESSFDTFKN